MEAFAGESKRDIGQFSTRLGMESGSKVVDAVLLVDVFKSKLESSDGLYLLG